ncbi:phosphatidylinositol 3-kinase, root isoform [Tanacetum coccineum]
MGPIQRLATQSANKYADHNGMSILNVMVEPKDRDQKMKSLVRKVAMYLHNLLLRDDGCLFHVDFGYNLGRDPKSIPPHVKLRNLLTSKAFVSKSATFFSV